MLTSRRPTPPPPKACTGCGRAVGGDCSRAVCPRRKPITAGVPERGYEAAGFGCYRRDTASKE